MFSSNPSALPDPTHWAVFLGLATLVVFLGRVAWRDLRRPDRVPDDAGPDPRVPLFRDTTGSLWLVCAITAGAWLLAGGGWASLGFMTGSGLGGAMAWTIAVLGAFFLAAQRRSVERSPEVRERYAAQVEAATGYDWVWPTTPGVYRYFTAMAVTAAITEEVIFRGFLIWVLALWLPLWVAAGVALLVFVGAHIYQGSSGMVRILPVSAVLTFLFLISGSLLPGILLHCAVDLAGGAILWILRDRREPSGAPQPIRSHS